MCIPHFLTGPTSHGSNRPIHEMCPMTMFAPVVPHYQFYPIYTWNTPQCQLYDRYVELLSPRENMRKALQDKATWKHGRS